MACFRPSTEISFICLVTIVPHIEKKGGVTRELLFALGVTRELLLFEDIESL